MDLHLTVYSVTKVVHVLLAIVAVGFNASYAIWLARAGREPEHESHVLRGIKSLDDRFANPAYGLLLLTGLVMVFDARIPLHTLWIGASLVLYVVAVVIGLGLFTPTLRRQIRILEAQGASSAEFQALSGRARVAGIATSVPVLIIVVLMVLKPTLG